MKDIEKAWKELINLENTEDVENNKVIGVLQGLKKAFNENKEINRTEIAEALETTLLKVQMIEEVSNINDNSLRDYLEINRNPQAIYFISKIPKKKLKVLDATKKRRSSMRATIIPRLVSIQSTLSQKEKDSIDAPYIEILEGVTSSHWGALADASKGWTKFSETQQKKLGEFSKLKTRPKEDWEWLLEIINTRITTGVISKKNGPYQEEIIAAWEIVKEQDNKP